MKKTMNKFNTMFLVILIVFLSNCTGKVHRTGKIAMIIAHEDYLEIELQVPKQIFEKAGFKVYVASSDLSEAIGIFGGRVNPDILINEMNVEDFDAVIFVGGGGASQYFNAPDAFKVARDVINAKKILAAICIAPVILTNAGLLKGKKATCFDKEYLKKRGVVVTKKPVQRDGNIITAEGPEAAEKFSETILKELINPFYKLIL